MVAGSSGPGRRAVTVPSRFVHQQTRAAHQASRALLGLSDRRMPGPQAERLLVGWLLVWRTVDDALRLDPGATADPDLPGFARACLHQLEQARPGPAGCDDGPPAGGGAAMVQQADRLRLGRTLSHPVASWGTSYALREAHLGAGQAQADREWAAFRARLDARPLAGEALWQVCDAARWTTGWLTEVLSGVLQAGAEDDPGEDSAAVAW